MKRSLHMTIAAFVWATFNVSSATLYVSLESTNPVAPYSTWATAATNIQDAVDVARAGDTVLVTNGVYAVGERTATTEWGIGGVNRVAITNAIRLQSVNGPVVTSIDGEGKLRCVYLGDDGFVGGFTLTNGRCVGMGGGIACDAGAIVTNCILSGNTTWRPPLDKGALGGGAFGGVLLNCSLVGNSGVTGGGTYGSTLYNCTLIGNSGVHGGGAFYSTLYSCTLTENSGGSGGGARYSKLYNCTLTGNSAAEAGGGTYESTLYNCTVTDNSAALGGGGASGSTLYNCIVYYNTAPTGPNYDTGTIYWEVTVLHYSCTTPLPTNGIGNIIGPPLFMDLAAGDFHLREESPCIDAGANLVGMAIVPFYDDDTGQTLMLPYTCDPTDILGNTRFIDGDFDGNVAWDIGAYEFNSFPPPRFTCAPQLMPGCWRLSITGAPNKWVQIQRSSDLKNWEDCWPHVFMGAEGACQWDDGDSGQRMMFYRAVVR